MQTNEHRPASPRTRRRAPHRGACACGAAASYLSIGWRLALGLAAVAAVLVASEILATRTTREALDAVRVMQSEHEPLASSANAVLERLVAFDGIVSEFMRSGNATDFGAITAAGDALEGAVTRYFGSAPQAAVAPDAPLPLRERLTRHIASARELAGRAAQRGQWSAQRQADLNQIHDLLVTAGGTGIPISGTQVYARRSLAELQMAIEAVRGNDKATACAPRRTSRRCWN